MCQLSSKLGSISSLAYITTRNIKADLARLKTGNTKAWHELCQEERQAAFEQARKSHISSIVFPWKDQICIWSTDNFESSGGEKKSVLCAESSFGKSCSSNYRHSLPKPSAVAFITPGRAAGRAGGEEETQVSQQPKPGCTRKLWRSDPNRNSCPGYPDSFSWQIQLVFMQQREQWDLHPFQIKGNQETSLKPN